MSTAAVVLAPSFGPAIVIAFGIKVPVLALFLSLVALFLARWISPPPLRKLTGKEETVLTFLLAIFLFLIVTGQLPLLGDGEPLGVGMGVVVGVGLGFSGLLVIELISERFLQALRVLLGGKTD